MTLALLAAPDAPSLPMPWARVKRVLDGMEARFVRGALRLQEARVQALRPVVERVLETGLVPAVVPLDGDFSAMVADFAGEVLVEGIVHATADVRAEERRARAAGVNLKVDGEAVVPKEALAFIESRRDLARFFDGDQVEKVRTIMGNALREGATVKQTMDALQTALPAASRARLENIARTEATAAYNQGRIYRFLQSKGFVVAVQFMAVLDSRVTDICQHRDGLLFAMDDPRLRENVPPLHFQCRSILSPVSGYRLQQLGGKERLEKDARAMDDAPGAQVTKKGRFGNEPWPDAGAGTAPRAKPVGPVPGGARAEEPPDAVEPGPNPDSRRKIGSSEAPVDLVPSRPGGGYSRKPKPHQLITEQQHYGNVLVPVVDAWRGTRELESVSEALQMVRPELLQGLRSITFINELVVDPASNQRGGGGRVRGFADILLSRDAFWNWSSDDEDDIFQARIVLLHEIGHHVYNMHMEARDIGLWLGTQSAPLPPGGRRAEVFAEQFAAEMVAPTNTPIGAFFARFRA